MSIGESDEDLVDRYRQLQDENAFKMLMDRHYVRIHRLVASILGTRFVSEVDDVVQEVFIRVHRGFPNFRSESKFGSWLYRIAYNHSLTFKTRCRNRKARVADDWNLLEVASDDDDPATPLNTSQLRGVLDMAIDRLPIEYQIAIRLHYWFHLPISEISMLTSTRENTIKSYLHRARKLLAVDLSNQKENL